MAKNFGDSESFFRILRDPRICTGMDSPSHLLSEEQLKCSICLDVFTNPVSTPCGHNFCMQCIGEYWDTTDVCLCPMCKKPFFGRPDLHINTTLKEIVEQFKVTHISTSEECLVRPGQVPCDFCTGRKLKAEKSCLVCLASYCGTHVLPHHLGDAFRSHTLVDPVGNLADKVCKKHHRLLEFFCRRDRICICQFCRETDHRAHEAVPIQTEWEKKKPYLQMAEVDILRMIQDRQKKVVEIRQSVELMKSSTQREIQESVQAFAALVSSIERSQTELIGLIEEKQRAEEKRAEGLITELEQEIAELQRRNTEMMQLSHTEDPFYFLQSFPSLSTLPKTKNWSCVTPTTHLSLGAVRTSVSQLVERSQKELDKLSETARWITRPPDAARHQGDAKSKRSRFKLLSMMKPKERKTYRVPSGGPAERGEARRRSASGGSGSEPGGSGVEESLYDDCSYSGDEVPLASDDGGITAVALYDYEAESGDEISIDVNDIVTDIVKVSEGWWWGQCKGAHGLFPSNYVDLRS